AQPARGLLALSFAQASVTSGCTLRPHARVSAAVPFETLTETTVLPITGEPYLKRRLDDAQAARMAEVINGLSRVHRISGAVQGYQTVPVFAEGRAEPQGIDVWDTTIDRALWIALLAPAASDGRSQGDVNGEV